MAESLRGRLLVWYTLTLLLVIGSFGATVCGLYWRSLIRDIDQDLRGRADMVAAALRPASGGAFDLELTGTAARDFGAPGDHVPYYAIWTSDGKPVASSDPEADRRTPARPGAHSHEGRREVTIVTADGAVVLVGRDAADARHEVWSLAGTIGGVGTVVLALALAGGWLLVGRTLAPIARITRTAAAMSGGDLAARIPLDRTESELEQVAVTLNAAFDRLELARQKERQFTADASHELRTPLAALWTEAEWALSRPRTDGEYRQSLGTCLASAARIRAVVEGLLTLARADAGETLSAHVPMSLRKAADEAVELLRPLAERRRVALAVTGDAASIEGDPDRLREMVSNLVSNAITYNVEGGAVDVIVEDGEPVRLTVSDTGVGIDPEARPRVFDRFFRADPARTRNPGGAGLGLAIAKIIAEAHGGSITCRSEPERGTTMEVLLPRRRQR